MEGCEILNKKLILWLGLAAGAAATGIHLFTDGSAALAIPCALISGVSCFMACKSKETQPLSSQGAISYENTSMLNDSLHKAYTDFDSIQESIKLIKDQQAKEHLLKLQSIAANMLHYMKKNPDRIPAAFQFSCFNFVDNHVYVCRAAFSAFCYPHILQFFFFFPVDLA